MGVFVLAAATLALEIVHTRILSVIAWYHLAFFVISVAMLGLTAGAVWVYVRGERFTTRSLSSDLANLTVAFGVSSVGAIAVQTTIAPIFVVSVTAMLAVAQLVICLAVPYFFAGAAISIALTRSPFPVAQTYGVDLLGAATGCLAALLLLNVTDGPSAVLWIGAAAAGAAMLFASAKTDTGSVSLLPMTGMLRRRGLIFVILAAIALANGLIPNGISPLVVKNRIEMPFSGVIYQAWNSFSRVMVLPSPNDDPFLWGAAPGFRPEDWSIPSYRLNIDGDAGTVMQRYSGDKASIDFLKYDITNLAYSLPDLRRGAVIGIGGGRDMLSAHYLGVTDVTGVEVNPIFVHLLTERPDTKKFAGLAEIPGLHFVVDDARSWFARSIQTFDVIQMSLIDTWAATGAGAFTLSENGLYTLEGWRIFLNHLNKGGVLTVSRWHKPDSVDETGRMVGLATGTLLTMGVEDPRRHIFVASAGRIATLILAREPLSAEQVSALRNVVQKFGFQMIASPDLEPESPILRDILQAKSLEEIWKVSDSQPLDLTPSTDNRPFFFNQVPLQKLLVAVRAIDHTERSGVASGNLIASRSLLSLFIVSMALVWVTIVFPLRSAIAGVGRKVVAGGAAYFLLIGLGFMLVEIGLLQRMSVFLGHPTYSLSIVLFTLILATGAGSLISDRVVLNTSAKFIGWSVATSAYLLFLPTGLPDVFKFFESSGIVARAAVTIATVSPAGILMGFGFPTGMRFINAVDNRPTPWFWGLNGAAGVVAGSVAVACSISFGIHVTIIAGACCYLLLIPAALMIGSFGPEAMRPIKT